MVKIPLFATAPNGDAQNKLLRNQGPSYRAPSKPTPIQPTKGAAAVWDESRNLEWENTICCLEPLKHLPASCCNRSVQIVGSGRVGEKPRIKLVFPTPLVSRSPTRAAQHKPPTFGPISRLHPPTNETNTLETSKPNGKKPGFHKREVRDGPRDGTGRISCVRHPGCGHKSNHTESPPPYGSNRQQMARIHCADQ
jgi:hypothetical protein